MRKFDIVETNPINVARRRELEVLANNAKTNRDLLVVAYHFSKEGMHRKSELCLNRIPVNYWTSGLYRDLWIAMLSWSIYKNSQTKRQDLRKVAEFFVIVQKMIPILKELKFNGSACFNEFYRDYQNIVKFTNMTESNKIE